MTDEIPLRRDVDRAARAQALLENDLLKGAFDKLEREYYEAWLNPEVVAPTNVAGRERLWQAAQIIGKVRAHLEQIMRDGKVAKAQIDALAQGGR